MYHDDASASTKMQSSPMPTSEDPGRSRQSEREEVVSRRCLVVDDNQTVMRLVAQMLTALGHRVEMAENGAGALGRISANSYDLVLTDLEMPSMNGFFLASKIRKASPGTKIVIMTGRCQAEVFDLMAKDVVDAWLFKPFDIGELFHLLDDVEAPGNESARGLN